MLCALLLFGLVPGSRELIENLAHLVHDGHLAHSAAHAVAAAEEGCAPDAEHDCTPLAHHCTCCVSLVGLPQLPELALTPVLGWSLASWYAHLGRDPPLRTPEPPYRPPIDT